VAAASRALVPVGGSVVLHVLVGALMAGLSVRARPMRQEALQIAVVDAPPPPPAPPPKPLPLKPPPRVARAPKPPPPAQVPVKAPLPPPVEAPPPPTVEAKKAEPAPVVVTGITMESTTQGGSFAVGVGNTLQGTPEQVARDPGTVRAYKAETYAPASQVTELPRPLNGAVNLRKYYPPLAVKANFEGDVVLRLLIEADGAIGKVEIVSDPGQGLGAAAARMVRAEYRFSPAKVNGTPVATTVPFTVHFTLN
jgi:periplasmic protein TonB